MVSIFSLVPGGILSPLFCEVSVFSVAFCKRNVVVVVFMGVVGGGEYLHHFGVQEFGRFEGKK